MFIRLPLIARATFLTLFSVSTFAASFDCAKAKTQVERMICKDRKLSAKDSQLAGLFRDHLQSVGPTYAPSRKRDQRAWLRQRNACQDLACLNQLYDDRILQLTPG